MTSTTFHICTAAGTQVETFSGYIESALPRLRELAEMLKKKLWLHRASDGVKMAVAGALTDRNDTHLPGERQPDMKRGGFVINERSAGNMRKRRRMRSS